MDSRPSRMIPIILLFCLLLMGWSLLAINPRDDD